MAQSMVEDAKLQQRERERGAAAYRPYGFAASPYRCAVVVFSIVWLFLTWPWLSGRVAIPWDAKAHFYPQFVFLAKSLHKGDSPFWTPNVFDGWPQIADPQSLIFAPFYLLAATFSSSPGFQLADGVLFVMLGCGGLSILAYARDRGWRAEGALVAAIAFAFGGSAAWRIQHVGQVMSLAWFPLAFFLLARALDRGQALRASFGWGLTAGAASAFMVLGRDQIAWLQTLVLAGYVLYRLCLKPGLSINFRRFLAPLGGGLIAGLIIALLPVLLTLALADQSNRPTLIFSEVVKGSLPPAAFLTLVSPNLFGVDGPLALFWGPPSPSWGETGLFLARNMATIYFGALPLAALLTACIGLSKARKAPRDRDAPFLVGAALLLALYALGRYTPAYALLFHLPGADLWRRPADATFPLCAVLALLAGYSLHRLIEGAIVWRPALLTLALGMALAICTGVAIDKDRLAMASGPLAMAAFFLGLSVILLGWLKQGRTPSAALAALGLLLGVDLSLGNGPNESTALPPYDFAMLAPDSANTTILALKTALARSAAPDRRDRVELAGLGFAWPNASLVHGFDHNLGYNPLRLALFEAFTSAGDHVALPEQRVFSKAFPSYKSIAADLTGLRFIATGAPIEQIDPALKQGDLTFIARTSDGYLYENPRAMPRVFIASHAETADFKAILNTGRWPHIDYHTTVLLAQGQAGPPARRAGEARITSYGDTEILVSVDAPDGGWLVLTDAYHSWWLCEVDGVNQPLLQADVMFRAVRLAPGARQVRFIFAPISGLVKGLLHIVSP